MKHRAFTLVELLVVIGIIVILAGVLLPVLIGAGKKADQAKARAEITTLVNAIKQYESIYGVLPAMTASEAVNEKLTATGYNRLIEVLQGDNPRKMKFLEVVGNEEGIYQDPWEQNYQVHLDLNYDGKIPAVEVDGMIAAVVDLHFSIVVWSTGPDINSSSTGNDKSNRDNVYSFPTSWSGSEGHQILK